MFVGKWPPRAWPGVRIWTRIWTGPGGPPEATGRESPRLRDSAEHGPLRWPKWGPKKPATRVWAGRFWARGRPILGASQTGPGRVSPRLRDSPGPGLAKGAQLGSQNPVPGPVPEGHSEVRIWARIWSGSGAGPGATGRESPRLRDSPGPQRPKGRSGDPQKPYPFWDPDLAI